MSTQRTTKKNAQIAERRPEIGYQPVDDALRGLLSQVLYCLPINGGVELREESIEFCYQRLHTNSRVTAVDLIVSINPHQ
jgi:hypothetical protein